MNDEPAAETTLVGDDEALARLRALRGSIDNLDAALVHLLAERFKCTQQVGELKARRNLPPADPAREADQIARLRRLASDARLDPAFAEKFLNFIIDEVVRHHRAIAARPRSDDDEPDEEPGDGSGGELGGGSGSGPGGELGKGSGGGSAGS